MIDFTYDMCCLVSVTNNYCNILIYELYAYAWSQLTCSFMIHECKKSYLVFSCIYILFPFEMILFSSFTLYSILISKINSSLLNFKVFLFA